MAAMRAMCHRERSINIVLNPHIGEIRYWVTPDSSNSGEQGTSGQR